VAVTFIRTSQLYAWKGPSLLIVDTKGECGPDERLSGYYFREARCLSRLGLTINGGRPWTCDATLVDPDAIALTYIYPELTEFGGGGSGQSGDETSVDRDGIPHRALSIRVRYQLSIDGLSVSATVGNYSVRPVECELAWTVDADFADIQEAHEGRREQIANVRRDAVNGRLTFTYEHPQLHYRVTVAPAGTSPGAVDGSAIRWRLRLEPQQEAVAGLRVHAADAAGDAPFTDADRRSEYLHAWRARLTRVSIPGNLLAERILAANIRDVASFPLLEGPRDEWLALQAGMPLYPALFGRDTLTATWQAAYLDRGDALDASLTRLGRMQSDRVNDWRDEEPGRIPYQIRRGPLALLDLNPYYAYYADFASPLMFVIALGHLYAWSGDTRSIRRHWDVARRILDWARRDGDKDRDGYLEYQTRSSKGTKNQGWKDSGDAIVYDDGTPVPPPIATCELQGYWFAAQQLMAVLSAALGHYGDARAHWASAADLKTRFNRDWWDDSEGSIALALDPAKRQVRAVTSNAGHCIASGIVSDDHLPRLVARLFAPDMFSGWGIRTLASSHRAYNPLSYHLGTVWAVEQATIAFGLRRFGFDARALAIAQAQFDLAERYPEYRVPECIGGYSRGDAGGPGAYPRTNTPQLWNASAFPLLMHSILGFQPVAPIETLIVDPVLPAWLPEVTVHGIRLGDAQATLRFWRDGRGASHVEVLRRQGTLRVIRQPPPESLTAGVTDRLGALMDLHGLLPRPRRATTAAAALALGIGAAAAAFHFTKRDRTQISDQEERWTVPTR
jgi:glycogen debranching enzyme